MCWSLWLFPALIGCSNEPEGSSGKGTGGSGGTTGGDAATGGVAATGAASSGGVAPTGGASMGGTDATGGLITGGAPPAGGGGTGGAPPGGTGGLAGGAGATGGAVTGGAGVAAGGASTGGVATGGVTAGGTATGGDGTGGAPPHVPAVDKDGETLLTSAGLPIVSYGGYLNGESFQQDGILTFEGMQYAAYWNTARHVVIARRTLPDGPWATVEFTDYTNTADDAHNTISLGMAPGDGTLHLSFDHHGDNLHYRRSTSELLTNPAVPFEPTSFGPVTSELISGNPVALVTYPRFVTAPGGNRLLLAARIGESGAGDEYLWEYDATTGTWTALGQLIDGISASINAYLHGIAYTPGGTRLHLAWCWRATPDPTTNQDLMYLYSDDHGRTWNDNDDRQVGTTGSTIVTRDTPGIRVYPIEPDRGLINQEHMTVDSSGRVHVLAGHLPDDQGSDSNFESARSRSQYFHYWRDLNGTWHRTALGLPVVANFRGSLAVASSQNLYAVLPNLRIAGASPDDGYESWTLLHDADANRFFSDPLIDTSRLLAEDRLTVVAPHPSSSDISVLDFTVY